MTRGRLAVHAHLYQPSRVDPFSGLVPADPSAAPFHDWNARIAAECYRPIAERGTLAFASFDLGPTLSGWLSDAEPDVLGGIVAADRASGGAMAQGFHHAILPLASDRDRRTEIRWALRDAEWRLGRRPDGFWLPETAVDRATLLDLAEAGVRYTILAPWQATGTIDPRRPYRVDLGSGRSIMVAFFDADLSAAISFDPGTTVDADRFARERVVPRFDDGTGHDGDQVDGMAPIVLIATDGELYGHHQPFRDLFLDRLVRAREEGDDPGYESVVLADVLREADPASLPSATVADDTSWSCHHGILRWSGGCACVEDGRWKASLRTALDGLAAAIDRVLEATVGDATDAWALRDAYVDVLLGAEGRERFAARWLPAMTDELRGGVLRVLEASRWRLAMYASDGWFWEDPARPETSQVLRSAARAARLADPDGRLGLERTLIAGLAPIVSQETGLRGAALYARALSETGRPAPEPGSAAGLGPVGP
jgi:hypothetical protein